MTKPIVIIITILLFLTKVLANESDLNQSEYPVQKALNDTIANYEYKGLQKHYPDQPTDFYDKYIECGLPKLQIENGDYTVEELDKWCEELQAEKKKKIMTNGLVFLAVLIVFIVLISRYKNAVKPGVEFQKMAEAMNGVYGVILNLEENKNRFSSEEIQNDILYCAYISQKEISRRINIYKWDELTPINVPLISNNTINVMIALSMTVNAVKNIGRELNLENEIDEIFSEGELFQEFERSKSDMT